MENYSKTEVRTWVQETVESIFKGEIKESIMSNVKIQFWYDGDEFWDSTIVVRHLYNGKWEICNEFFFTRYFANYWNMVTKPWVDDMIGDITDEVMKFIHQPKKKEW